MLTQGATPIVLDAICDGFIYNPQLRANTENYDIMSLGQLELLRRSKGFTPKLYAVPDFGDGNIPNYQTIQKQISVEPGSWLWSITAITGFPNVIGDGWFFVTVRDDDTGDSLFGGQFVANQALRPYKNDQDAPINQAFSMQKKLTQPRLVSGRGILDVQISCTPAATPSFYQIVLCFAQSCSSVLSQDPDLCQVYEFNQ